MSIEDKAKNVIRPCVIKLDVLNQGIMVKKREISMSLSLSEKSWLGEFTCLFAVTTYQSWSEKRISPTDDLTYRYKKQRLSSTRQNMSGCVTKCR